MHVEGLCIMGSFRGIQSNFILVADDLRLLESIDQAQIIQ